MISAIDLAVSLRSFSGPDSLGKVAVDGEDLLAALLGGFRGQSFEAAVLASATRPPGDAGVTTAGFGRSRWRVEVALSPRSKGPEAL